MTPSKITYSAPTVRDLGTLRDLTAASLYFGTEDASAKVNPHDPIPHFS